jgi:hypothetical protein
MVIIIIMVMVMLVMAWHTTGTPIRLTSDFAESPSGSGGATQVDADVVRASVILLIHAISCSSVATQCLDGL